MNISVQGGRSCAKARTFCCDIKIFPELLNCCKSLGKKSAFFLSKAVFVGQGMHFYIDTPTRGHPDRRNFCNL